MGPDYQVYMCVTALRHLQQDILQHTQTQDLQIFLKVSITFLTVRLHACS